MLPLAVLLLLGGCGWFGDDGSSNTADLAAIAELNRRHQQAINGADIEALGALTPESQILILPEQPPLAGQAAIEAAFADLFDAYEVLESTSPGETALGGDWAYQRGTVVTSLTPKSGSEPQSMTAHYLRIFARQSDGSWRMTIEMRTNADSARD